MQAALLILLILCPLPAVSQPQGEDTPGRGEPHEGRGVGVRSGQVPLIDLGAGSYRDSEGELHPGGLYPGGLNHPPAEHLERALAEAAAIVPLGHKGEPSPEDGLIGMVGIGLSNTAHEFGCFERLADAEPARNPRVVLINGGHSGNSAEFMVEPGTKYWDVLEEKVRAQGLKPQQVQVAWISQRRLPGYWKRLPADLVPAPKPPAPAPARVPGFEDAKQRRKGKAPQAVAKDEYQTVFPANAEQLQGYLGEIVRNLRARFPNVRLCYLSDRMPWPEPEAYEEGFAIKWLVAEQIGGAEELNWDPARGAVVAPLLLWGPYIWADGDAPNGLGTRWLVEDFEEDQQHPSALGERKVADLLLDFLITDPSAAPWFARDPASSAPLRVLDASDDAHVDANAPEENFGASPTLATTGGKRPARAYLRFDLSGLERPVAHAKLSLRVGSELKTPVAQEVFVAADDAWTEAELCYSNAPALGQSLGLIPRATRDGTRSLDVTAEVNAHPDDLLTLVVTSGMPFDSESFSRSREGGDPPRLVLVPRN